MADLSITKLPWKTQLAVFLGLSIAAAGAFYYFYEMPARVEIETQQSELTSIRDRITRGLAKARALPQFRKDVGDMQARLEGLRPILPEQKDVAELLRRVNTLATQSNLTIRGFKPEPVLTRTMHAEWPNRLEIEGTYHNFGLFLDSVSKFPRIINISKIDMKGRDRPDANATIDVSFTATTFVLLAQPKPPVPGAPPAKTE